ncbi:MAG: cbb3-type cytochrome c oxidase subunit II [Bacteroidetes bacterium]|nr:cbb3-type cytochrome c oxidase subunit II [Bacteroidota bacterium]
MGMERYSYDNKIVKSFVNLDKTTCRISAMRKLGVPYQARYEEIANDDLLRQEDKIVNNLKAGGLEVAREMEIVALIAYLQRLGTNIKVVDNSAD